MRNPPDTPIAALSGPDGWRTESPLPHARAELQRKSFRIAHALADNPLFEVETLIEVAKQAALRPSDLYFDAGKVDVSDKWGQIPVPDQPVESILDRIENAGAWIIIKHVELDPAYAAVLNEFAAFARQIAGPNPVATLNSPEMLVLITSPNRITPFHFDAEVNFLVQIQGYKDVWVCDPLDRAAVTDIEIEKYYMGQHNAGTFKPGTEQRATHYLLEGGDGIHIPSHGGHWVKNGNAVSVSLSLNFELPRSQYCDIYRANHYLRRFGLNPRAPGKSLLADRAKTAAMRLARRVRGANKK